MELRQPHTNNAMEITTNRQTKFLCYQSVPTAHSVASVRRRTGDRQGDRQTDRVRDTGRMTWTNMP